MESSMLNALRTQIAKAVITAGIALALLTGVQIDSADAAKSMSMKCSAADAGFLWANEYLDAAQKRGDKAGAAFWTEVSWGFQSTYLAMGCAGGGLEGLTT